MLLLIFITILKYFPLLIGGQIPPKRIACFSGKNENSQQDFCMRFKCFTLIHYTSNGPKIRRGCVNERMQLSQFESDPFYEIFYCDSSSFCNNHTADFSKFKSSSSASRKNYVKILTWGINTFNRITNKIKQWFYG
uniref:Uncharacterized protein n=1 Tax=Strongyloides stercoralis TaxID=6248 RepID=A0A0K0E3Q6_STRER